MQDNYAENPHCDIDNPHINIMIIIWHIDISE